MTEKKYWIIKFEKNDFWDEIYAYDEETFQKKLQQVKDNEFITEIYVKTVERIK